MPQPEEFLIVRVECYAGHRGEESPRRFWLADQVIEIETILDRWLTPDHRYFKVRDPRGNRYVLRHDVAADQWISGPGSTDPRPRC
jgi:hypothetical protein